MNNDPLTLITSNFLATTWKCHSKSRRDGAKSLDTYYASLECILHCCKASQTTYRNISCLVRVNQHWRIWVNHPSKSLSNNLPPQFWHFMNRWFCFYDIPHYECILRPQLLPWMLVLANNVMNCSVYTEIALWFIIGKQRTHTELWKIVAGRVSPLKGQPVFLMAFVSTVPPKHVEPGTRLVALCCALS